MRDLWKSLAKSNSTDAVRVEGCRGCIHFGLCDNWGCCNYFFDTDMIRPCPPGRGCTVKKLASGQWPTEAEHKAELEKVIQRAKWVATCAERREEKKHPVGRPKQTGRPAGWDTDFGFFLYSRGWYYTDIADLLGTTQIAVSGYSNDHFWADRAKNKPTCKRHTKEDGDQALIEYTAIKDKQDEQTAKEAQ